MSELIHLRSESGASCRCTSLDEAKIVAASLPSSNDRIFVDVIPGGTGGPMLTLEFDKDDGEWNSAQSPDA